MIRPRISPLAELAAVQAAARTYLGAERLAALHRQSRAADAATLLGTPLLAVVLAVVCGVSGEPLVIASAMLGQGCVLQWFGLLNHEFFVHRRVGGRRFAHRLALLFTVPIFLSFTRYMDAHKAHHRFIGSERDAEGYKQDIDTRWKRLLFCTIVGVGRAAAGRMGPGRQPYFALREATPQAVRNAGREQRVTAVFAIAVAVLAWFFPAAVILGYLVPLLVVLPVLNALRILYEHAELMPENRWFIASRFRCGLTEEVAFLWDAGEFHLIHHYFPSIPFYRMRAARRALDPFFDQLGIPRTTGRLRLLRGWFVEQRPHRAWWGDPATAAPAAGGG